MPAFPLTVPPQLHTAISNVAGEPFADSYLWGAELSGKTLRLRTLQAWHAVQAQHAVRDVLRAMRIESPKPTPWPGDGSRMSAANDLGFSPEPSRRRKST